MASAGASPSTHTPLAALKRLPDGAEVVVRGKWVTGSDLSGLWLEEADRSAAIRAAGPFVQRNSLLTLTATLATQDGERVLTDCQNAVSSAPPSGFVSPPPLGLASRPLWAPALAGPPQLSTTGRLVTVCGRVTWVDEVSSTSQFIAVDDGSGVPLRADIIWNDVNPPDWLDAHVRVIGVADVTYRTPQDDSMEWNGELLPACWCRRVVCEEEEDVLLVDSLPAPTGGTPRATISGHIIAPGALEVPVRVYTAYGFTLVQPEEWSGNSAP